MQIQVQNINVNRSFNPSNKMKPMQFFMSQIQTIKNAVTSAGSNTLIITGDFNLNESKRFALDYRNKNYFVHLNATFDLLNLIKIITQPTWQRVLTNVQKHLLLITFM